MIETDRIPLPKIAIQVHRVDAAPLLRKFVSVSLSKARSLSDHITRVIEENN